ncbi:hypothetical protein PBY51_004380 [Eleginops maclovinus]|uniref:Secreted protein n=1 Tax=Eleginops maclovinus TaxID=56733 RepID=A0AAN8AWA8_ELEMC|nr:hypothetical protein PBY51_004380 [Eleginops maclovinus]
MWLIVLAGLLHCASAYDVDLKKLDGLAKARVEVELKEALCCIRVCRLVVFTLTLYCEAFLRAQFGLNV